MNENNNKMLISLVIGVITLILLTVGATYAYFLVGGTNNFGSTPVNVGASASDIGSGPTLIKVGSDLTLNLSGIKWSKSI